MMNNTLFRARQVSLALLVIAVVDHGHLQADYAGANPNTSGLMRLGRDLLRRQGNNEESPPQSGAATGLSPQGGRARNRRS